jgi:hypothetical protein
VCKHSKYYGVGKVVRLRDNPLQTGRVIGASHSQDRYLIMWNWNKDDRYQGLHSRTALLPVEKV